MTMTQLHWLALGLIVLGLLWLNKKPRRLVVQARDLRVIDGDTLWLADARGTVIEKMRLASIDAPETRGLKSLWQGSAGQRAKDALARLLTQAGTVEIVRLDTDRYGRTLVKVYDARTRGREFGLQLADAGYARYWE
jgi:endonuclease YncB( thermonuclease family)